MGITGAPTFNSSLWDGTSNESNEFKKYKLENNEFKKAKNAMR